MSGFGRRDIEAAAHGRPDFFNWRIQPNLTGVHCAVAKLRFSARRDDAVARVELDNLDMSGVFRQRIGGYGRARGCGFGDMPLPQDPAYIEGGNENWYPHHPDQLFHAFMVADG